LNKKITNKNTYIFLLLITNVIIRVLHHFIYEPIFFHDTNSYLETTNCLLSWDFTNYRAIRPPIYPLLLSLQYIDERVLWLAQSLMGIINSILIFLIAENLTKVKIAFMTAILYTLSFNILFAEAALLSETTSIFFLLLTINYFIKYLKEIKIKYLFLIGILSSLAILTRPIMIVLVPAILISLYVFHRNNNYKIIRSAIHCSYFLVPVILVVFGISYFNKIQVNYFSITTLTGFNLSNHSGAFIELCQDSEYQQIKEILIEYRNKRGTHRWGAIEAEQELMQRTGLNYPELSKKLTMMSIKLFLQHPILYLKNVVISFINYWGAGNVWDIQKIKPAPVKLVFENLWKIQKIILISVNLFFIITIISLVFYKRSLIVSHNPVFLLLAIVIVFSSLFQAMVEYGENTRYKLPFQPLILVFIIKILYNTFQFKVLNKTTTIKSYFSVIKKL
jgi:4-amino-4-deoxy-L-arabinose transferase-like glycosyltransferase